MKVVQFTRSIVITLKNLGKLFHSGTSDLKMREYSTQEVTVVLAGTLILSFISNTLSAFYLAICIILYKLISVIEEEQIRKTNNFLEHHDWQMLRNNCCKILEYVKFTRMIELGYEMRSNTNIILHEEKQNPDRMTLKLGENQRQIQEAILKIQTKLMRLHKQIAELMGVSLFVSNQSTEDYTIPLLFRHSFQLYRSINLILDDFSTLRAKISTFYSSPFVSSRQIKKITNYILNGFIQSLEEVQQAVSLCLSKIEGEKESVKHHDLFIFLAKNQQNIEILERQCRKLVSLPQYAQEGNVSQGRQNQKSDYLYVDSNLSLSTQINGEQSNLTKTVKDIQSNAQRRQFMRKLDALLVMGLARRRQEQIQKDAKQQQINEEQSAVIFGKDEAS